MRVQPAVRGRGQQLEAPSAPVAVSVAPHHQRGEARVRRRQPSVAVAVAVELLQGREAVVRHPASAQSGRRTEQLVTPLDGAGIVEVQRQPRRRRGAVPTAIRMVARLRIDEGPACPLRGRENRAKTTTIQWHMSRGRSDCPREGPRDVPRASDGRSRVPPAFAE